ncbi:helix-turn-helix domain-containing protein [Methanoculleus methanifontis]|nr:helix-turn-helix domain-containing protein [Methanoculleus sp. FWC-SCC3]
MRKMIIEVCLKDMLKGLLMDAPATGTRDLIQAMERFMDGIESIKPVEMLKVDLERGEKVVVADITMKEGYTIDDIEFSEILGSIEVLKTKGRTHTCFVWYVVQDGFLRQKMHEFALDVIWTSSTYKPHNVIAYTCIGDAENLNKVLRLMSTYGEVRNVIFEEATFSENHLLSQLTPRQRDLLIAANRYGYYMYPRKINSQQLAEKLGISKATAIEHLRKAEARLISTLLTGY